MEDMNTACARFVPSTQNSSPSFFLAGSMLFDTLTYPYSITAYHKNKSQEAKQLSQYLAIWIHLL